MLDPEDLAEITAQVVREAVKAATETLVARIDALEAVRRLPGDPGEPGKDGIGLAAALIDRSGALILTLSDGNVCNLGTVIGADAPAVNPAEVEALVAQHVERAVAALPPAPAGKDVDPAAVEVLVVKHVERAVAKLPVPPAGKDADPALVEQLVTEHVKRGIDAIPPAPAGKNADPAEVEALVAQHVERAVAALPPAPAGKTGVGLAGAIIDREGKLTITLSDGTIRDLGQVVGRDGNDGIGKDGEDGRDGIGFDDLGFEYDGERGGVIRFSRGETIKEFRFRMPVILDRGVFKAGQDYEAGDAVTWAGSLWIAQCATGEKPGEGSAWRLAVKRGRDGKDIKGDPGEPGKPGRDGRDLTQLGFDGEKH